MSDSYYGFCTRCNEWHKGEPLCQKETCEQKIKALEQKLAEKDEKLGVAREALEEIAKLYQNCSGEPASDEAKEALEKIKD